MTILDELAAYAALRVEEARKQIPLAQIREQALALYQGNFPFSRALQRPGLSFLCEVKRASPSKGLISPDFPYCQIAQEYQRAGADGISCLTEPKWFLGSDEIFRNIRRDISLPMLRKDFTVDIYQLYEAKCMGADAVLLIAALLDTETIARYLEVCHNLGLSALVETHNAAEIAAAADAGADIIGINNRNLKDFSVDFSHAALLREKLPPSALFVAESGIQTPKDAAVLKSIGADAVLIGEALMKTPDKTSLLAEMRRAAQ